MKKGGLDWGVGGGLGQEGALGSGRGDLGELGRGVLGLPKPLGEELGPHQAFFTRSEGSFGSLHFVPASSPTRTPLCLPVPSPATHPGRMSVCLPVCQTPSLQASEQCLTKQHRISRTLLCAGARMAPSQWVLAMPCGTSPRSPHPAHPRAEREGAWPA